jgi:lysophospholipase L1-like esterase
VVAAQPGSGRPAYVALGDSISIDEYAGGRGRGGASLLARNRDDDFPQWRGRDLESRFPGLRWHLLATDGGTTLTMLEQQLPRLDHLPPPSIVTVTVGGNDVLSRYGDTRAALEVVDSVRQRVGQALDALHARAAPDGVVIVGTVYDPSDGSGDASSVGLPPWPDVVAVLGELNAALRDAARQHGGEIADIHAAFMGHGLSRGNVGTAQARPDDRDLWYCNVIEPNAWGAGGVRQAFWSALKPHLVRGAA